MPSNDLPNRLDRKSLLDGVEYLASADPALARVVERHGPPPLWARRPGIATLIRIILEQQVSLASGAAIYKRIEEALGDVSATSVSTCGIDGLRAMGVTRQKASYCMAVADAVSSGRLDFRRVAGSGEDGARTELMQVKGIGEWTADVYLLMVLRRPDVWPVGDVALQTALSNLLGLPTRLTAEEAAMEASRWRPWRAVAVRILWHGYLEGSLRRGSSNSRPSS